MLDTKNLPSPGTRKMTSTKIVPVIRFGICGSRMVMSGRFFPLPRWLANIATILALFYVAQQIISAHGPPLMFIGQFLVLLQIIKLFEQRANRDYAQLLVLSLLLMVAACINTASLLFGILMIFYLFVSLYCCLIFHLKVEADRARAAFAIPEEKVSPATLRQDQRYLASSMRRLTWCVDGHNPLIVSGPCSAGKRKEVCPWLCSWSPCVRGRSTPNASQRKPSLQR